eukprot:GEMP01068603.1.p1 GENE.GEMP01068603.1~~GEMP01068603.1.p1  ORF type:complete len:108 (-),score=0.30 GEMP01068603.1:746-1069(-)
MGRRNNLFKRHAIPNCPNPDNLSSEKAIAFSRIKKRLQVAKQSKSQVLVPAGLPTDPEMTHMYLYIIGYLYTAAQKKNYFPRPLSLSLSGRFASHASSFARRLLLDV